MLIMLERKGTWLPGFLTYLCYLCSKMDFYHHCTQYRKAFKEYTFDMPVVFTVGLSCSCLCSYHPLFLNEHRLILLLTQAKAQVLYLLLSHWVGQWIKPLHVSTAAPCLSSACLRETQKVFGCQSITHMLASSYVLRTRQYRQLSENEFSGILSLVSLSSLWPVGHILQ